MYKDEKERLAKYGKLICDFANAKTTDDILVSYFQDLQSVFNLPNSFTENILKKYQTKKMIIGSLSNLELNIFEMLLRCNEILLNLKSEDELYCIDKYDPIKKMVSVSEVTGFEQDEDGLYTETIESVSIPKDEIDAFIDKNENIEDDHKDDFKEYINELVDLSHKIENLKPKIKKRFEEIEEMARFYPSLLMFHKAVEQIQVNLKTILLQIIKSDQSYQSKEFRNILSHYNKQGIQIAVSEQNQFIKIKIFSEKYFLEQTFGVEYIFNSPISYCLIEYLKNSEYCGRERLFACAKCNDIFSKSRLNDRQIFCPVCSRKNKMTTEQRAEYMKAYRSNPARKKVIAKQNREERIRHLMADAGKTRKQAEIIIDNEM